MSLPQDKLWTRFRTIFRSNKSASQTKFLWSVTTLCSALLISGCTEISQATLIVEAQLAEEGGALLIGDSIALGYKAEKLCGKPLFNAGIGGTGARDWVFLTPKLVEKIEPSVFIVSLGIVDVRQGVDPDEWEKLYEVVISRADAVVLIGPIEHKKIAERPISSQRLTEFNNRIRAIARRNGIKVVEPLVGTSLTTDGIHLNRKAYAAWGEKLTAACP